MNKFMTSGKKNVAAVLTCGVALAAVLALAGDSRTHDRDDEDRDGEAGRARIGLAISPVKLNFRRRDKLLVGLGSYIVNAQAACSECHTWPQFAPGGNPFLGDEEEINTPVYMAGGRPFGPIVSNNITPDATGRPAGMTFDEFEFVMRSGVDRDHSIPPVPSPDNDLMQVMPWPVFRNMSDRDMRAVYEYLSAIPSVP